MLHLDDRAGAEPHELGLRLLDLYFHWKPLRYAYPVERSLDVRQGARKVHTVGVKDARSNALDDSLERLPPVDH